jgi:iron(II)-dependent oxidoreductase
VSLIAFCLLTYRPDHPSGIERSIAALVEGVRELGHTPLVIAAGPVTDTDHREPALVRLESVRLPRPATNDDVLAALADPGLVAVEVAKILRARRADLVCWADTLWGLGYLSPAPTGITTALMVHKIRPVAEQRWRNALAAADIVCPASDYLLDDATCTGLDTRRWVTVPNTLLEVGTPPPPPKREQQRRHGPVRVAARVEPAKGLVELLAGLPHTWRRPVELVLAEADFEFWPGMQRDVLTECRAIAQRHAEVVSILPALPWRGVPPFLGGAAATVISSTEPETFCHTAAEALSVGTPVVTYDLGNVPRLAGEAGRAVPLRAGPTALWTALDDLMSDHLAYHAASRAAPGRVAALRPAPAARTLLDAAGIP